MDITTVNMVIKVNMDNQSQHGTQLILIMAWCCSQLTYKYAQPCALSSFHTTFTCIHVYVAAKNKKTKTKKTRLVHKDGEEDDKEDDKEDNEAD